MGLGSKGGTLANSVKNVRQVSRQIIMGDHAFVVMGAESANIENFKEFYNDLDFIMNKYCSISPHISLIYISHILNQIFIDK